MKKLLNINQLCEILDLVDKKTHKPKTYILRYWEKNFHEISPKRIRNRRYYSPKNIELIKMIKFLLKDKGMSISGVKGLLKKNVKDLDDHKINSLKENDFKNSLKYKSKKLLLKIKKIKNYGKKNSS